MRRALIELHFLPNLEYFSAIRGMDQLVLERFEHFNKQTFRNRCLIMTTQGPHRLTVPVTDKHGKVIITDIRLDERTRWRQQIWRSVVSAYAKAPFFEHYASDFEQELFRDHQHLYDLNRAMLSLCLRWLSCELTLSESVSYEKTPGPEATDLRGLISAKSAYSTRNYYAGRPYQQVFGSVFEPNLSLLDLIFCEGPRAGEFLGQGQRF
jgi:hypothetical protein